MHSPFEMVSIFPVASLSVDPLLLAALKATALIGAAGVAATMLRRASAATRHLVWALALVGALGIPLATLLVPAMPVRWLPNVLRSTQTAAPVIAAPAITVPATIDEPKQTNSAAHSAPVLSSRVQQGSVARDESALPLSRVTAATGSPAPSGGSAAPAWRVSRRDLVAMLPFVWLAGALLVLGRRALASFRLARLGRRSELVTDSAWLVGLEAHARQLDIARPVTLRMSDRVGVPMTWGTLRPTILLPADAFSWSAQRRSVVLLHELAHVRRLDTLALFAAHLAAALYWFNPIVWLAARHMRAEAERACDDHVLRAGMRPSAYAGDLLEIARSAGGDEQLASAALAMARRSQLEGRLLAILDPRQPRGTAGRSSFIAVALVTLAGMGLLAAVRPAESRLAPLTDTPPRAATPRPSRVHPSTVVVSPVPATPAGEMTMTVSASAGVTEASATVATPDPISQPTPEAIDFDAPATPPTPATEPTEAAPSAPPAPSSSWSWGFPRSPRPATAPHAEEAASPAMASAAASAPAPAAAPVAEEHSHSGSGSHSSWSVNDNGIHKSWSGTWTGVGFTSKFKAEGEVKFNNDLTDVESMGNGAMVTLEEQRMGSKRRAELRNRNGQIERAYYYNGVRQEWNAEARVWFSGFLVEADRNSGFLADIRYPRLMAKGGPGAVLDEISLIHSDYAKGVYYQKLLAGRLDAAMLRRAIGQAGNEMKSDYELARVLTTTAQKNALEDEASRSAFLGAVDQVNSDYEHARVLMMLVERDDLSPELAVATLQSATRLGSDYERGRLLTAFAEKRAVDANMMKAYVQAARSMHSDYEKGRALTALVQHSRMQSADAMRLMVAATTIGSDYERANLLVMVATRVRLDSDARAAYREAAHGIHSSYEQQRALAALGDNVAE
jgi:beta-lactamase regulating signal transducer with metallopeptidase domain